MTDLPAHAAKPASPHTVAINASVAAALPLDDPADFERARRGLVATHPTGRIERERGGPPAWDTSAHDFLRTDDDPPPEANPSLWRQARLNAIHGLFEVRPGVWQARGYDLSNITFLAGDTGWLVIDPLTTTETARACLGLANSHLGERPVTGVVYTHSHVDHFGGICGVVSPAEVAAGRVPVLAPEGFLTEAVSENVVAGPVMSRRAAYMFGQLLPPGPTGQIDSGLGKTAPGGTIRLVPPTIEITETGHVEVVDGIRIEFQLTPGTEAPAEMNFFFPDLGVLCMAENCTHTMHNILTPRGAQVRDALAWSKYINEAIERYAGVADVMISTHHWPRWGREDLRGFLTLQRDLYRWLHDQTMRLANRGLTPDEISDELELAPEFAHVFACRGYYGTVSHNSKAISQRYLGWFDGNPATLWPHPPVEAGRRYVEFMGGADAVLAKARESFDAGDYRWVTEVVNHVVFADPANTEARHLQADALEQLGYQAESGPWRNFYLTGARELRQGPPPPNPVMRAGVVSALTIGQLFDTLGVRLLAPAVTGKRAVMNWRFTDLDPGDDVHVLGLSNSALYHTPGRLDPDADVTVTTTKATFTSVFAGATTFMDALAAGEIVLDGDADALLTVFGNLDTFDAAFPIVEP